MSEPVPIKYPYKGNVRWAFFKWADIPDANDKSRVYLRRLRVLQTPLFAIYLHWIYLPDRDRDPHDHPCNFWSFIVRGGYNELVFTHPHSRVGKEIQQRRFSLHKMPIEFAHRILTLKPNTITLCCFGRRRREWGFWTPAGFVNFNDYADAGRGADPFGA